MPSRTRRFGATMIYNNRRRRIIDYLGSHQHLAVDIDLAVTENSGLQLTSRNQRFRTKVDVRNRIWGWLFGYNGPSEPNGSLPRPLSPGPRQAPARRAPGMST